MIDRDPAQSPFSLFLQRKELIRTATVPQHPTSVRGVWREATLYISALACLPELSTRKPLRLT